MTRLSVLLSLLVSTGVLFAQEETPESYAVAAKKLYEKGDFQGAKLGMDKAISLAQTRPAYYYERARIKMDLGRPREAIVDLGIAVMFDDNYSEAWQLRGIANYVVGDYGEAHRCLYLSIVLNKKSAKSWLWCGIVSQRLGDDDSAVDFIKKALEYTPKNGLAWFHYGISLTATGKPILGADKVTKAIELEPSDASYYSARALAYLQQAIADEDPKAFYAAAKKDIQQATKLQANFVDPNSSQALLAFMQGNTDAAVEVLRRDISRSVTGLKYRLMFRLWGILRIGNKHDQAALVLSQIKKKELDKGMRQTLQFLQGDLKADGFDNELQDILALTQRWYCRGILDTSKRDSTMYLELCSIRLNTFEAMVAKVLLAKLKPKKN